MKKQAKVKARHVDPKVRARIRRSVMRYKLDRRYVYSATPDGYLAKSPRKWILWDGAKLWMIARTWRRLCTMPTLADYTSGVEDGTWRELFCDGSGVMPVKKEKVLHGLG